MESSSVADFTQVVFHDIEEVFSFHSPLKCRYTIEKVLTPTTKDWIGLFKLGWRTVKEYVYFEWSPLPDNLEGGREVDNFVIFKAECLPKDTSEFYQFLYVASSGKVCGASPPFQFRNPACSEFVEVDETPSMMIIHPKTSTISGGSETLMENLTFSSLPGEHGSVSSEGLVFNNSEEIDKLKNQLADTEQEVAALKTDKQQLEFKLQQHNTTASSVAANQNDSKLIAALAEVTALKKQLATEELAKKKESEQLHEAMRQKETLSTELVKKEKELTELKQRLSTVDGDAVSHTKTLDTVRRQKDQLTDENDKLKKLIEKYTVKQLELTAELDQAKKEIVQLKSAAELNAFSARQVAHTAAGAAAIPAQAANLPAAGNAASAVRPGIGGRHSGADDGAIGGAASAASSPEDGHWTCPYCSVTFPRSMEETLVMDHIASHEDKICPVCDKKFPSNITIEEFGAHVEDCLSQQT